MRKSIYNDVEFFKCHWLEDFKWFPSVDRVDIYEKALSHRDKFSTKIYEKVIKILDPLPLSQRFKNDSLFKTYLSDIAYLIAEYQAIEYVEPLITQYVSDFYQEWNKNKCNENKRGSPERFFQKQLILMCVKLAEKTFKGKADGYISEIGYLLTKFGILKNKQCTYKQKSCFESDCLKRKLIECHNKQLDIIQPRQKKTSKDLYSHVQTMNIPKCLKTQNISYQDCKRCRQEFSKIIKNIQENKTDFSYLSECTFSNQLRILKSLPYPLFNPCPSSTKQIYEAISDRNKRWEYSINLDIFNVRRITAKQYVAAKIKKEKGNILSKVEKYSCSKKSKRAIAQTLRRENIALKNV